MEATINGVRITGTAAEVLEMMRLLGAGGLAAATPTGVADSAAAPAAPAATVAAVPPPVLPIIPAATTAPVTAPAATPAGKLVDVGTIVLSGAQSQKEGIKGIVRAELKKLVREGKLVDATMFSSAEPDIGSLVMRVGGFVARIFGVKAGWKWEIWSGEPPRLEKAPVAKAAGAAAGAATGAATGGGAGAEATAAPRKRSPQFVLGLARKLLEQSDAGVAGALLQARGKVAEAKALADEQGFSSAQWRGMLMVCGLGWDGDMVWWEKEGNETPPAPQAVTPAPAQVAAPAAAPAQAVEPELPTHPSQLDDGDDDGDDAGVSDEDIPF